MEQGNSYTSNKVKKILDSVNDLIGQVCPAYPIGFAIKSEWENIVGKDMAKLATFSEIKLGCDDKLCIVVEVLNSASVVFRYNFMDIKDKISKVTGYSATHIDIIIKQVSRIGAKYKDAA